MLDESTSLPLLFLLLGSDVALWCMGCFMDVGQDTRFRLFAAGTLLLFAVLVLLFGWGWASAILFAGLWVWAIFSSAAKSTV